MFVPVGLQSKSNEKIAGLIASLVGYQIITTVDLKKLP
ncbi:MAG: hypothetical protein ACI8RD_003640 [Bacillariaceae sp.]|jgi:hypothetical protein